MTMCTVKIRVIPVDRVCYIFYIQYSTHLPGQNVEIFGYCV